MANLPNPYWAVGAVYIVAHPLSGATTSKGIYRLIGTAIGGVVTIILVPNLVNSPELLTVAIGLWTGLCLGLSLLDRTPRSYAFMLAGYTVPIAGFAVVSVPNTTFDYTVGRVEEIAIGIICAALVSRLIFPRHSGTVLIARIDGWLRDSTQLAVVTIRGKGNSPEALRDRQRLAADAVELRALTTHVAYDTSAIRGVGARLHILQQRMIALLPIVSSLHDVLALRPPADGPNGWDPAVQQLLDEACAWLESEKPLDEARRAILLRLINEVETHNSNAVEWHDLLPFNIAARVRDLVQIVSDCYTLRQDIESGSHHVLRWRRYDIPGNVRPMHKDYGMALLSGFSAFFATCVGTGIWIVTGWPQGGVAAMMATIFCCIFATMDDPVPSIRKFGLLLPIVIVASFIFEFGLLPLIDGFVPLMLALGLFFVPAGVLLARPATFLLGLVLCLNLPTMILLQQHQSYDFASFANSNLATVIGIVIAACVTSIVRSVGAEWSAQRLLRAGWIDIARVAHSAKGRVRRHEMNKLLLRMMDRIGLIVPRLATMPTVDTTRVDLLRDLRNGMNTIDLQQYKNKLPADSRQAVENVLSGIESHYRGLSRNRPTKLSEETLLKTIDQAIAAIIGDGTTVSAIRPRRALVALRFGLFPGAKPFSIARSAPVQKSVPPAEPVGPMFAALALKEVA